MCKGGNFSPFTYEWVDVDPTGQMGGKIIAKKVIC